MSSRPGAPPVVLRSGYAALIGRSQGLAALAEHLAEARDPADTRHPTVVLFAGAPGIGKTRLLEEFPVPELAAGVVVIRGGASQATGMPPYLPFLPCSVLLQQKIRASVALALICRPDLV